MTVFRDAVVARLAQWRVEDDREKAAAEAPLPYVLVEFPPEMLSTDRWSSRNFTADATWQTTCVGVSRRSAEALHAAVVSLLDDWVPTVPGWNVWPVGMDTRPRLQPPYRGIPDRVLHEVVVQWTWHATRTTPNTP